MLGNVGWSGGGGGDIILYVYRKEVISITACMYVTYSNYIKTSVIYIHLYSTTQNWTIDDLIYHFDKPLSQQHPIAGNPKFRHLYLYVTRQSCMKVDRVFKNPQRIIQNELIAKNSAGPCAPKKWNFSIYIVFIH